MPQGQRNKSETIEFKTMLPNINLIFLGTQVLIIMDSSYFSRFWTLFEAWLSMQQVTSDGLLPASTTERYHIECIHTADAEFDGPKLKKTWRNKTPKDAYDILSSNDIQVTNLSDKEEQLPKLLKLNEFAIAQYAAWQGSAESKMERWEAEMKRREDEMKQREKEMTRREKDVQLEEERRLRLEAEARAAQQKEQQAQEVKPGLVSIDAAKAAASNGDFRPLVALVTSGTDGGKEEAAGALRSLAGNDDNATLIRQAGYQGI